MRYRWSIARFQEDRAAALARQVDCSVWLAQCLLNRGIDRTDRAALYLEPRLRDLGDPFLLPDMAAAVRRLVLARLRGETVVLFGDYDVDGVSATAILREAMADLGWAVAHYLPSRFDEGYGLSLGAARTCVGAHSPRVLLAIDCGSTSTETIDWLGQNGIDVIVLDHHQLADPLPQAVAIVNPRRGPDECSPGLGLCSAGLAFKLVHALVKEGRAFGWPEAVEYDLRPLLDLAALGTVADLVALTSENRILVSAGLQRLGRTERPGLMALKALAGCADPPGVWEVAFQLAPRLNAAGRLETAADALDLLLTRETCEAERLARRLDAANRQRQQLERGIARQAIETVCARFDATRDFVIVEGRADWHIGVVGIVASRVLRQFHRPTIILGGDGPDWRGSGRSIEGFDLGAALRECSKFLLRHGGHAMAAGLSLRPDDVDAFRSRLNLIAQTRLRAEDLQPVLQLDAELPLSGVTMELTRELHRLEPIGQGNPPVQFALRGLHLAGSPRRMGGDGQHARFRVADGTSIVDAVWWNCESRPMPQGQFELAVAPQVNDYRGKSAVQLKVLDWRPPVGSG